MPDYEVITIDEDGQYAQVKCYCGSQLNPMPDESNICLCGQVWFLTNGQVTHPGRKDT